MARSPHIGAVGSARVPTSFSAVVKRCRILDHPFATKFLWRPDVEQQATGNAETIANIAATDPH